MSRLYEIRIEHNLSQRKFAEVTGISRNKIVDVELGRSELTERQKTRLCNLFGIRQEWYDTGQGEKYIINPDTKKAVELFEKFDPKVRKLILSFLEGLLEHKYGG